MSPHDFPSAHTCPSEEVLAAYDQGRLPAAQLEVVADHLTTCGQCLETLNSLHDSVDPLIANLRRFVPDQPPAPPTPAEPVPVQGQPTTPDSSPIPDGTTLPEAPTPVPAEADLAWPRAFGRYELLEKIAQGGMGIVYKARQLPPLERLVALKVIAAGPATGPEARARFRVEAQAVARLKHPHIVQIYDYGEQDGQPYFSMELMEGGSLKQRLAGRQQPERAAAELVRTLALGVEAAHQVQIIHRDLKPGNVMLDKEGVAKIGDFGLAKLLDDDQGHSLPDAIMGTPSYMAPEQARGDARAVGPLADVYALGAILYEMLTGRPPFSAGHRLATLDQVRSQPPSSIVPERPHVSLDLEAICLKCLEKDPQKRYASAKDLADDLGRWLRGEPTVARPLSWPQRAWRKLRRHTVLSSAAVLGLVAVGVTSLIVIARDPERAIGQFEDQLAQGKPVELFPDANGPRWFHLLTGQGSAQTARPGDGSFSISTWDLTLCELIRNPGQDRYRFRAKVQFATTDMGGMAGLYFAHQATPLATTDLNEFMDLTFNDIMDVNDVRNSLPPERRGPAPQGNPVWLETRLYAVTGGTPFDYEEYAASPGICKSVRGAKPVPWHLLVVEVTPDTVCAFWDDQMVKTVATANMTRQAGESLAQMRQDHQKELAPRQEGPCLNFRGGLGLFVYRASANFRDVAVEPMEVVN
jgi:serine/threonine-protein kinase